VAAGLSQHRTAGARRGRKDAFSGYFGNFEASADEVRDPVSRELRLGLLSAAGSLLHGNGLCMVRRTCPPQLSAGNVAGAADGDPGEQAVGHVPDVFKRVTGEPRRCNF